MEVTATVKMKVKVSVYTGQSDGSTRLRSAPTA